MRAEEVLFRYAFIGGGPCIRVSDSATGASLNAPINYCPAASRRSIDKRITRLKEWDADQTARKRQSRFGASTTPVWNQVKLHHHTAYNQPQTQQIYRHDPVQIRNAHMRCHHRAIGPSPTTVLALQTQQVLLWSWMLVTGRYLRLATLASRTMGVSRLTSNLDSQRHLSSWSRRRASNRWGPVDGLPCIEAGASV